MMLEVEEQGPPTDDGISKTLPGIGRRGPGRSNPVWEIKDEID